MKEDHSQVNLSALEEMLCDEHKIVTYISLSRDLCIHVNESKNLLSNIVKDIRKKQSNVVLNVNYLISGLLEVNKAQTAVCNEAELSEVCSKFKIIFFQHIYSVNVGTSSADNVSFMAVNKFEDFPLYKGLIKNDVCGKRPADEIGNMKTHNQEIVSNEKINDFGAQKKIKEEIQKEKCTSSVDSFKKHQAKSVSKPENISPKKNLSNGNKDLNDHRSASKGIAGFFSRRAGTTVKKPINGVMNNRKENTEKSGMNVKTENVDIDEDSQKCKKTEVMTEKMDVDGDEKIRQNVKPEKTTPKDKSNNKLLHIKKTASIDKKRKRVLHVSDSESEDENNDPFVKEPVNNELESDDEIPPTPATNTVKITSGIVNPKKKRKFVDKTYTDEDGYILTKKEEVYESCSETEEETKTKENIQTIDKVKVVKVSPKEKKNGANNKKKNNSPQKSKQSTISTFFKKI